MSFYQLHIHRSQQDTLILDSDEPFSPFVAGHYLNGSIFEDLTWPKDFVVKDVTHKLTLSNDQKSVIQHIVSINLVGPSA
jgi:hypothetical protein